MRKKTFQMSLLLCTALGITIPVFAGGNGSGRPTDPESHDTSPNDGRDNTHEAVEKTNRSLDKKFEQPNQARHEITKLGGFGNGGP